MAFRSDRIYSASKAADESALRQGAEETGQMNSTCRGEREGLNCKTRRQRGCVLKAGRQKRCFRVDLHPGDGVRPHGAGVQRL